MPRLPKQAEALLDGWPAPEKAALEWETMAAATMERIRSGQSARDGMDILVAPLPAEPPEEQVEPARLRDLTTSLEALELSQSGHAELREGNEATARSVAPRAPALRHERFRGILWAGAIAAAAAGLALYVVVRSHNGAAATPASSADLGLSPLPSSPVVPATRIDQVDLSGRREGLEFHVSGPTQQNEKLVLEAEPGAKTSPSPARLPAQPSPEKAAVPSGPDAGVQAQPGPAPKTPGAVDRTDSLDHIPAP